MIKDLRRFDMRAEYIFYNSSKEVDKRKIEEKYLKYIILEFLYERKGQRVSATDIADKIEEVSKAKVNISRLRKYLSRLVSSDKYFFYLNRDLREEFEACIEIKKQAMSSKLDREQLLSDIKTQIKEDDYTKSLIDLISLGFKYYKKDIDELIMNYFDDFQYKDLTIEPFYDNISIDELFQDEFISDLFKNFDCFKGKNIAYIPTMLLNCLFKILGKEFYNKFINLTIDPKLSIKKDIQEIYSSLSNREILVLKKRIIDDITLEEIAKPYNLTRERIRQIQVKATDELKEASNGYLQILSFCYSSLSYDGDGRFIEEKRLEAFLQDKEIYEKFLILLNCADLDIKWEKRIGIIYDEKVITPKKLEDEFVLTKGNIIYKEDAMNLKDYEKAIIKDRYKLFQNSTYIIKSYVKSDLICLLIDELFPKGYTISNRDQYQKLKDEFAKRYKDDTLPSMRDISTYMNLKDYTQVRKGTYIRDRYCIDLPSDLVRKMLKYIREQSDAIYYMSIYHVFEKELKELGVDNHFYLKGLLDKHLDKDMKNKRDYIKIKDSNTTAREALHRYIKSLKGVFSIEDILEKFPSLKPYIIYFTTMEMDDIICLSNKQFLNLGELSVSKENKETLKDLIDQEIDSSEDKLTTSRKLYSILISKYKQLIKDLKIVNDQFSLFSVLKVIFGDEYYFSRPLISKEEITTTSYRLVLSYVYKYDYVNKDMMKDFLDKYGLKIMSYNTFYEKISDDYVMLDRFSAIKKEKFDIKEEDFKLIKKAIDDQIERFGMLNTDSFDYHTLLPKISYRWNSALLAGIARTFFSDYYSVICTNPVTRNNIMDEATYVIKKL